MESHNLLSTTRFTASLHAFVLTDNTRCLLTRQLSFTPVIACVNPIKQTHSSSHAFFFPPNFQVIRGIFFNLIHYQLYHESSFEYHLFEYTYTYPYRRRFVTFYQSGTLPTLTPNSTYILTSFSKVVNSTRRVFIAVCVSHSRCTLFPINDRNFDHRYKVSRYIVSPVV